MDNTKLSSDYHFSPSRHLTGVILLFYGISACLSAYYLAAIQFWYIPIAYCIILVLAIDAIRLYRTYAGQTAACAIVRVLYSSREKMCYLYNKTGEIQRAQVVGVLCCLPNVIKIDFQLTESRKRRFLFVARDQLPVSAYHQFCLRMEEVHKMFKN
jgi:hypothetical protein